MEFLDRFKVLLSLAGLILVISGLSIGGYAWWHNSSLFVTTDDANLVADLVQVGSLNAGRIISMNVEVGGPVVEGQVIATVDIPNIISRSGITDTTKMGFRDVQDQLVEVVAPRPGVIAARWVKEGDTVTAGEPIVSLMDPRRVWIVAHIDESKIERVRPGQLVEVDVKSLNRTLVGRVATVSPVTVATLGPPPERSSSSNFRRVAQVVTVKITLDEDPLSLIPGSSAKIKIRVR
jgi:multidrug resistance efflux pump